MVDEADDLVVAAFQGKRIGEADAREARAAAPAGRGRRHRPVDSNGRLAVVVMNRSEEQITFALKYHGAAALVDAPAHSITTYRFEGR